jgi:hypothetical protein
MGLALALAANEVSLPLSTTFGFYALFFLYLADGVIISFPRVKFIKPTTIQIIIAVAMTIIVLLVLFGIKIIPYRIDEMIPLLLVVSPIYIFIFLLLPQLSFIKANLTKFERTRNYYSLYFLPVNLVSIVISSLLIYDRKGHELLTLLLTSSFILITVAMLSFMSAGFGILLILFGKETRDAPLSFHYRKLRGSVYEGQTYGIFLLILQLFDITFSLNEVKVVILITNWIFLDFLIVFTLNTFVLTTLLEKSIRV